MGKIKKKIRTGESSMRYDIEQIKKDVIGKWRGVFQSLGITVPDDPKKHGPCPRCGGKDRFRMDDKDGRGTWFCNSCGSNDGWAIVQLSLGLTFIEAVERVAECVGSVNFEQTKSGDKPDPAIRLRELWKNSFPLNGGDLASKYLRSRGLVVETQNLRYCDTCYEPETKKEIPAMIAAIQSPKGDYIRMHRTYLNAECGRADIESQKKLMPPKCPLSGSAVRLFKVTDSVGVSEGIETAIAAKQLFDIPVWACISSTLMESFEPPEGIRKITIFGDNDANYAGQKAAYRLANKLYVKDFIVDVQIPDINGDDWADVLNKQNKETTK
jgi:putative DNA primase/helicase